MKMDQKLMEKMFSDEQGLHTCPSPAVLTEDQKRTIASILEHMSRISPVEADMVELHLLHGLSQAYLGRIFGYTQPNIHYRVNRGLSRLRVYSQIDFYEEEDLRHRLSGFFTDKKDIEVLVLLYVFSSQSYVARLIGDTQGKVRYRYLKCLKSLSQAPNLEDVYRTFKILSENITLLRVLPEDTVKKRVIL
jgi:hypothetical protein